MMIDDIARAYVLHQAALDREAGNPADIEAYWREFNTTLAEYSRHRSAYTLQQLAVQLDRDSTASPDAKPLTLNAQGLRDHATRVRYTANILVISGSRNATLDQILSLNRRRGFDLDQFITLPGLVLIHGDAPGVDTVVAERVAELNPSAIIESYPADWKTHGKKAGPIRNLKMIGRAERLSDLYPDSRLHFIALPAGESRGTRGCARAARESTFWESFNIVELEEGS